MSVRPPPAALLERVARAEVVVCCGSGGVGKTTVSAALGMALASRPGRRVLVLTIDPARRLATALGMAPFGTRPVRVPEWRIERAGLPAAGALDAAMLDTRSEWDRVVERYAPSRVVHDRILANPFYRGISDAFAGSQEYVALEALYGFHTGGEYDCVVIDTPPSRDALAFLEAPDRLADFVGARLISWLAGPSRFGWRAMNLAAAPFLRMADRLLGGEVLEDLGVFVNDVQTLYAGVRERAGAIGRLLRSQRTALVLVTTLEPQAFAESEYFAREARRHRMPVRAIVVNRVLPAELEDERAARLATRLAAGGEAVDELSARLGEPFSPAGARRLGEAFLALHGLARLQAAQLARLGAFGPVPVVRLPLAPHDVASVDALGRLAAQLGGQAHT